MNGVGSLLRRINVKNDSTYQSQKTPDPFRAAFIAEFYA